MTNIKIEPEKARQTTDKEMLRRTFALGAALFLFSWFVFDVLRGLDTPAALTWAVIMATVVFVFNVLAEQLELMSAEVRRALGAALIILIAAFAVAPQPPKANVDHQIFVDVFGSSMDYGPRLDPNLPSIPEKGWGSSVPSDPTTNNPSLPSGPEDFCDGYEGNRGYRINQPSPTRENRMGPAVFTDSVLGSLDAIKVRLCTDPAYLHDIKLLLAGGFDGELPAEVRRAQIQAYWEGTYESWSLTASSLFGSINDMEARLIPVTAPMETWGYVRGDDPTAVPSLVKALWVSPAILFVFVDAYTGQRHFLNLDGGASPAWPSALS